MKLSSSGDRVSPAGGACVLTRCSLNSAFRTRVPFTDIAGTNVSAHMRGSTSGGSSRQQGHDRTIYAACWSGLVATSLKQQRSCEYPAPPSTRCSHRQGPRAAANLTGWAWRQLDRRSAFLVTKFSKSLTKFCGIRKERDPTTEDISRLLMLFCMRSNAGRTKIGFSGAL